VINPVRREEGDDLTQPAWRYEEDRLTQIAYTLRDDETLSPVDLSSLELLSAEPGVVQAHRRGFVAAVQVPRHREAG